jgi:hypothetical protein
VKSRCTFYPEAKRDLIRLVFTSFRERKKISHVFASIFSLTLRFSSGFCVSLSFPLYSFIVLPILVFILQNKNLQLSDIYYLNIDLACIVDLVCMDDLAD